MRRLTERPRLAVALSFLIAAGTALAIAISDGPGLVTDRLSDMDPKWLLAAFGVEFAAYTGYVLAYRATMLPRPHARMSMMLTVRLVLAGFGPFAPMGGFAFDRKALAAVHRSRREARRRVLALGVVEYLLLAPAAFACALILLFEPHGASLALTLPWIIGVPVGLGLAWWATEPRRIEAHSRSDARARRWLAEILRGAAIVRQIVREPRERPDALVGMAVYWAAEIACLAFALRCFHATLSVPALVIAYSTGYAASRRSLPLGGAGITEALLTISLIAVHVPSARALLAVVAYRLVNLIAPVPAGLVAHSSLSELTGVGARGARARKG
ncbi:MAG TPA: lysylphosphatidylglycerol synthase domain-containing protein [Solirubrobacteraceae bacterium]|nr:lysylphosphatidylglycerol synthase domain-containing protein [Solirubrobacteraceae bacterium]